MTEMERIYEVDKVADNFISWLVDNDHFDKDYIEDDREDVINDLQETRKVAPRLYNLIANLTDR